MSTNVSGYFILVVFVVITALGLLLGLLSVFLLWLVLGFLGIHFDYWVMTEALSTAVTAAAVLGAGFVAYRELAEISSSRHMEVADRLFNELNSTENVEARRWIYQHLPDDPQEGLKSLTPEGQAAAKQVLNSLDRVAFLTQAGWIPEEILMPWMHPMIAKSWQKLEPYILYERQRRNEPDYYKFAGELAKRCQAWRAQNLPGAEVKWVEDAL
ncbi:MAG: DUF4760 domain-containing protein [Anaerolineales bacterium]|jgi:hypothetical protein